jgi:Ca2+/Na+ antiporter
LAISSEKEVEHLMAIATALKLSPLMIGLIVVSLGTDFPEIINSIISSVLGRIDIYVGDSFGLRAHTDDFGTMSASFH